jgi:uncharacterized DUF497 family protein
MTEEVKRLFAGVREFGWDPIKREANLRKHGIDFEDAVEVFDGPILAYRSDREEERWVAIGSLENRLIAVVFTRRAELIRIISRDAQGKMKKANIVTRKWGDRRKGKTDWARVDALTDADIAKAVANDPDAAPIDIDWSDAVLVMPAKKKAISIRVDEDVLDFFKRQGEGYQRRMNAVLRSYMQQKSKPKKRA